MTAPLDPQVRSAIRTRARFLRRRRVIAAAAAALITVGGVLAAVTVPAAGKPSVVQVTTGNCPASSVPVQVVSGASASLTRIPQGWSVISPSWLAGGATSDPDLDSESGADVHVQYGNPAEQSEARTLSRASTYAAPSVSIDLSVVVPESQPPWTMPDVPNVPHPPINTGTSTSNTVIDGYPATVYTTYTGPGGLEYTPAYPVSEAISWKPAPDAMVSIGGVNVRPEEMQQIAQSAKWSLGTTITLPAAPNYKVSAATAERALPAADRSKAHAALTSWAEVNQVGAVDVAPQAVDYRSVWFVYSPGPRSDWAVVDAHTGDVLQHGAAASWTQFITNRADGRCQPPLGVLTANEVIRGGSVSNLILTTGVDAFQSVDDQEGGSCGVYCEPLVWMAVGGGQLNIYDAISGHMIESTSPPPPTALPASLDPGATSSLAEPQPAPEPQPPCPGLEACSSPPTTTSSPTTVIVGPSPFVPGTTATKPAPAGNGKGPNGSCNGTETYPPCGPGVVVDEYYPYTLPDNCTGDIYFNGRYWSQELFEPDQPTENVWIELGPNGGAGWTGPGAVGLQPAPPGPPPACGTTPASVPPLQG